MPWHDRAWNDAQERITNQVPQYIETPVANQAPFWPLSLVLIKPDAFDRGLAETILTMLFDDGFRIEQMKTTEMTPELCDRHYAEHTAKDWYPGLKEAMCGKKLLALALNGDGERIREACTVIRAIYVDNKYVGPRNLVHSSDSPTSALKELVLWFPAPKPESFQRTFAEELRDS